MLYGSSHNPTARWQHKKNKINKTIKQKGHRQNTQNSPAALRWHNKALLPCRTTKNPL
jgi:hypothetical protein